MKFSSKKSQKSHRSNSSGSCSQKITDDEVNATHNDVNSICSEASHSIPETNNHVSTPPAAQKSFEATPNENRVDKKLLLVQF